MSHLVSLARSPFDLGVFARAAQQRLWRTLGHLMLLVAIASGVTTWQAMRATRDVVRKIEPELAKLPKITIRDGKASADVPQPWVYRFGNDDHGRQIVFVIDTKGRGRGLRDDELGLLLERTQVTLKWDDEENTFSLDKVPDMTIGPDTARAFIAHWMRRLPFYFAALFVAIFLFTKITQALLLVLAALAGSARRPLRFGQLFSIGVYALGPAVLLDVAAAFVPVPFTIVLYCAVAIVYAVLGARRASAPPPADALDS